MKTMKRIAIQGYRGAFHQEAAEEYFGEDISLVECDTFEKLIECVNESKANYGVMAIENSLVGCILPNFVLLRESGLNIIGEVYLRISQNLMALPNQSINDLHQVQSHGMAIAQCKPFFQLYPNIQLIESADTALSAKIIAKENLLGVGAIGSNLAASLYGLEVLAPSIETNKVNFTRFLVVSHVANSIANDTSVKATIAFTAKHIPGGLSSILSPLANEGVNLTMLHSLPMIGSAWEYIFHADLCYCSMEHARRSMIWLSKKASNLWVMGVYPTQNQQNKKKITLN
jgi:prephenate dehydratase